MFRNKILPMIMIIAAIWWGQTILVDFVIVKSVFTHIKDFFEAGDLGISLFMSFNKVEVILASLLVGLLAIHKKRNIMMLVAAIICWIIAMIYFSYLSPKISFLTEAWKMSEVKGTPLPSGFTDLQQEHQFYHNLYISLDTVKLCLLTFLLGLGIWKQEKFE